MSAADGNGTRGGNEQSTFASDSGGTAARPARARAAVATATVATVAVPPPTLLPERASGGTVKSLRKGLRVLEILMQKGDVGTTEIARALTIDKGAASRIMKTLAESGFAVQGPGRRYQPGRKLRGRGLPSPESGGKPIRERARPLLERLHQVTGETLTLALRADDQVLYLDKVDTTMPLRVERPVGTLSPLHCTALGKVFLAYSDAPLPPKLTMYTSRTPINETALAAALADVVARGYAIDDEEFGLGIRCVAAPLRDASGTIVAAIGISGPTARISAGQLPELGELVKRVAGEFVG